MPNLINDSNGKDDVVEVEPAVGFGVWSENIESYFIKLIEDEVKKGNKRNTTLTKPAWKFVRQKLKEFTKRDYSQEQLKNKYNQLRQKWKDFGKLLEETGIGYNSISFQVFAEEDVWKTLYEKHKSAKSFKKKGCKHYDKLCTIFGDTTATSANVIVDPSTKSPSDSEDEDDTKEEEGDKQCEEGPKPKKVKSIVKPNKLREKRVNIAMANALVTMSENSKKMLELLEKQITAPTSTTSKNVNNGDDHDLLMKCIDELAALEGIDGLSFAKATKLIHDDPVWRKIFLKLPDSRKKDLVLNI